MIRKREQALSAMIGKWTNAHSNVLSSKRMHQWANLCIKQTANCVQFGQFLLFAFFQKKLNKAIGISIGNAIQYIGHLITHSVTHSLIYLFILIVIFLVIKTIII